MLQIKKSGLIFSGSSEDLAGLSRQFQTQNYIRFPRLLELELLQQIDRRIASSPWHEMIHERIGVEICVSDKGIVGLLNFVLNNETLFHLLEQITGCGRIGSFGGRIYRMIPLAGHHDSWHTDMGDNRMLALTLNLSKEIYQGGVLQICERRTEASFQEVPNTGFGDAVLFRLASHLQHRVTDLTGTVPKTAYAGWFRSQPDFSSVLRKLPNSV